MILTLCGSLHFEPYWHEVNKQLGLAGHICFSVMTFPSIEGAKSWYTPEQKWTLDLAHLAKIEESDGVVMLNVDGYLGESSLRELEWARMRQKHIYWCFDHSNLRIGSRWNHEHWAKTLADPSAFGPWKELVEAVHRRQMDAAEAL